MPREIEFTATLRGAVRHFHAGLAARAVDRIDAEDANGGTHNHLKGRTVTGWLTPDIDAQPEAAQLEFERGQGVSPELTAW